MNYIPNFFDTKYKDEFKKESKKIGYPSQLKRIIKSDFDKMQPNDILEKLSEFEKIKIFIQCYKITLILPLSCSGYLKMHTLCEGIPAKLAHFNTITEDFDYVDFLIDYTKYYCKLKNIQ